jgi:hypothetical protein
MQLLQSWASVRTWSIQVRTCSSFSPPGGHRPGQVHQEAVHALHLLLDELDVVPDAPQQHPLVADHAQQRAHGARRQLGHVASSDPPPAQPAGGLWFELGLARTWQG